MKKLAIGCVVLIAVVAIGGTIGSYMIYRKVSSTVSGFAELATIPEIERSVTNRTPFRAPASGELSPAQLDRYLTVQRRIRTHLGARVNEFERRYRTLQAKDSATVTDAPALISAYRDLATGYVEAKRVQVDALNEAGLSLDEYRWVRRQAYTALGMPMMDMDVAQLVQQVQSGGTPARPVTTTPLGLSGTPATLKLVEPHRKVLEANAGLAFFGL
jgi:hypothetical protein